MNKNNNNIKEQKIVQGEKLRDKAKMLRYPVKIEPTETHLKKPKWIRAKFPGTEEVIALKNSLKESKLNSVCEEANCPNIGECFTKGVASFMIMGDICTRRCSFCAVAHGRPNPLDENEPENLAKLIAKIKLKHAVITSVDRDDLLDGGAEHFAKCIIELRKHAPQTTVEILTPDFRGRGAKALQIIAKNPPDIFNHNLETTKRLYKEARAGADYEVSLNLLSEFKLLAKDVLTKSGIMVGLGETNEEILEVMQDLRNHKVDMLTIGQYLQPSKHHLRLKRYVTPDDFKMFEEEGYKMGFTHIASGPMVRSSYFADISAEKVLK